MVADREAFDTCPGDPLRLCLRQPGSPGFAGTTGRPGTWSVFFCAANAVNSISAASAGEIQRPVASSTTASVYSILVQASSPMLAMRP